MLLGECHAEVLLSEISVKVKEKDCNICCLMGFAISHDRSSECHPLRSSMISHDLRHDSTKEILRVDFVGSRKCEHPR